MAPSQVGGVSHALSVRSGRGERRDDVVEARNQSRLSQSPPESNSGRRPWLSFSSPTQLQLHVPRRKDQAAERDILLLAFNLEFLAKRDGRLSKSDTFSLSRVALKSRVSAAQSHALLVCFVWSKEGLHQLRTTTS